jgi:hypothetical protein
MMTEWTRTPQELQVTLTNPDTGVTRVMPLSDAVNLMMSNIDQYSADELQALRRQVQTWLRGPYMGVTFNARNILTEATKAIDNKLSGGTIVSGGTQSQKAYADMSSEEQLAYLASLGEGGGDMTAAEQAQIDYYNRQLDEEIKARETQNRLDYQQWAAQTMRDPLNWIQQSFITRGQPVPTWAQTNWNYDMPSWLTGGGETTETPIPVQTPVTEPPITDPNDPRYQQGTTQPSIVSSVTPNVWQRGSANWVAPPPYKQTLNPPAGYTRGWFRK